MTPRWPSRRWASVFCLALAMADPAWAQTTCSLAAQPAAFGSYNPQAPLPSDSNGSVTVTCQHSGLALTLGYAISLSAGGSGQPAARLMGGPSHSLGYGLYVDPLRTQVWGDGSGGTFVVQDSVLLAPLVPSVRTYTVYGRIPAAQSIGPGSYVDSILVTLTF